MARLIKALDGETLLAESPFEWQLGDAYGFELSVVGSRIQGSINGRVVVAATDELAPLRDGGIALVCADGRMGTNEVIVSRR